ncbi:MAG: sterol desaturase family protein [Marmoricola sp.]
MTEADPRIEANAAERLARDEAVHEEPTGNGARRTSQSLGQAWRAFARHPSPWLIGSVLVGAAVARGSVHRFSWTELVVPVTLVALFPVIEWVVHVCILHWRPRHLAWVAVDSLLARKHRAHHADPRDLPLGFIPWQVELWLLPSYVVVALVVFPDPAAGLSFLVVVAGLLFGYEWVHYLVHSDYRPKSAAFRAVWRNHRLHHYKNEHYWFTVTTSGTADRLFGTDPDPSGVPNSPTVKALHASGDLDAIAGQRARSKG